MIDFYDVDLIEQYLLGALDKNKRQLVEVKIAKEFNYAQEIELYKLTLQAIKEVGKNNLKKDLAQQQKTLRKKGFFNDVYKTDLGAIIEKSIEKQGKKKLQNDIAQTHFNLKDKGFFDQIYNELDPPQKKSIVKKLSFRWLAVAASIVLVLVIGGYWLFFSTPTLFEQEFALYPDNISQEIDIQLNATGFKPINKKAIARLQEAMLFYNKQEFQKATPLFEQYLIIGEKQWNKTQVQLYLAISYLGLEEIEKAQNILISLHQQKNNKPHASVAWYLALSYIKQEKTTEAQPLLEALKNNTEYKNRAIKLLEKLQ